MDKRVFWSSKSPLPEWHSITFSHPSFDAPIRLVANQFAEVTLGGFVHTPAPMTIKPPAQASDGQAKIEIGFPRQVVGRQFKQQLALVVGSRAPIAVKYAVYLGDTAAPELSWDMYVADAGGVQFSSETVQVLATVDNPMRRNVAPIYDPSVFTGLEIL